MRLGSGVEQFSHFRCLSSRWFYRRFELIQQFFVWNKDLPGLVVVPFLHPLESEPPLFANHLDFFGSEAHVRCRQRNCGRLGFIRLSYPAVRIGNAFFDMCYSLCFYEAEGGRSSDVEGGKLDAEIHFVPSVQFVIIWSSGRGRKAARTTSIHRPPDGR
jgi:hypothetical protein